MNYTVFFWGIMYLAISRGSVLLWLLIYSMWKHRNVTDGGTIIYDGGFYEIVKWHQMTGKDDLYYDGIGFSIMGIPLYGDAEVK